MPMFLRSWTFEQLRCLGRRLTRLGSAFPPIAGLSSERSGDRFERLPLCGFRTTVRAVTSPGQDLVSLHQQNLLTFRHKIGISLPLWAPGDNIWAGAPSGSRINFNVLARVYTQAIFMSSIYDTLIYFLFLIPN